MKPVTGGVLFAAASRLSVGTVRKHASVSVTFVHPTWSTTKSYVPWISVVSPVGTDEPEFIMPARNKPSVFPPLVNRWKKTEKAPALSPQLQYCQSLSAAEMPCNAHLHSDFRRITAKGGYELVRPPESSAF